MSTVSPLSKASWTPMKLPASKSPVTTMPLPSAERFSKPRRGISRSSKSSKEMVVSPTGRIASKVIASLPELFDRPAMNVPEPGALDTMTAESTSTVASRSRGPAAGV